MLFLKRVVFYMSVKFTTMKNFGNQAGIQDRSKGSF